MSISKSNIESLIKTSLESISLDQIDFKESAEQINKLAQFIANNKQLKFIYTSEKKLNVSELTEAIPLFMAMKLNKNIYSLSLSNEDEDFIELLCSFIKNTTLTKLNLSNNEFSPEATIKLLQAALQNKSLTLILNKTSLSEKAINGLKNTLQEGRKKSADDNHSETLVVDLTLGADKQKQTNR